MEPALLPLCHGHASHPGLSLIHILPIRDADGTVIGIAGINRDVSERMRLEEELRASELTLRLNCPAGDILLFFTDGVGSLEEEMMKENGGNPWRYQQPAVQLILDALNGFLMDHCAEGDLAAALDKFVVEVLADLKERTHLEVRYLEDDAALGIVLTETVLKHYRSLAQ